MAQAGYQGSIHVSVDNSTFVQVPAGSFQWDVKLDTQDVTVYNTPGVRSFIPTLFGWNASCDLYYEASDASLTIIRNHVFDRAKLYVRLLPNATVANGRQGEVLVTSYTEDPQMEGAVKITLNFQGTEALPVAA